MRKKAVQQGRSKRRGEGVLCVLREPLSDARTPLTDFFRILLSSRLNFLFGKYPSRFSQCISSTGFCASAADWKWRFGNTVEPKAGEGDV